MPGGDKDIPNLAAAGQLRGEALFHAVFDDAAIGITIAGVDGRPVRCNPALQRILGYTEAELCRMAFTEFTHPEDVKADYNLYQDLIAGKLDHYQIEKRYIRNDRQIVWARLTVSLVSSNGGKPEFVVGMVEDITAQKLAQEALRDSEEKSHKAFHGNPYPTLITRRSDSRILEVNQAFADWYGVTVEEARGRTVFDFGIWPARRDREELLKLMEKQGSITNYPKSVELPSGEIRDTLLSVQPITIANEDCLLAISTDVTPLRKAEQALQRSEERLRRGLEAARTGTWEWDLRGDHVTWSEGVHSVFGLEPGQFGGTFDAFSRLVHEEDRKRVEKELSDARKAPAYQYFSYFRGRWEEGSIHWLEGRGEVRRDAGGMPLTMLGTVVDVTVRKRVSAALRSSEERLRATVENTPHVPIQWYDANGVVLYWNQASEFVYGWNAAEAHGKTLDQLIFEDAEYARFMAALKEVERTGKSFPPTEFRFHRRNGEKGVCLSTLFRMPRDSDEVCFVCMDVDVTEQKKAEDSLREAGERELRSRENFTRQLIEAEEQERQRLAAELHDGLGQNLSIIKNKAYTALEKGSLPPAATEQLRDISRCTADAIAELRDLVRNLRPLQIEQLGLTDALRMLVEKAAQSSGLRIDRRIEDVDDVLKGSAATHVYRIVQEALNNLVKHAGATRAELRIERDIHCVRLRLSDNGGGFEVKAATIRGGFGLTSLGERAQMLGGSLKIQSIPGTGTTLIVELPIRDEAHDKG